LHLHKTLLLAFVLLSSQVIFAKSSVEAEAIFDKSIKLFSLPNISFIVDSQIISKHSKEKRSFFLAKKSKSQYDYSLLIRFIAPSDIKCTAVLVVNKKAKAKRYAYFPALDRVRIIPTKDENKEVFGIGISYDELSSKKGDFVSTSTVKQGSKTFHKLVLIYKNKQTNYYINQQNNLLEKIEIHKNKKLVKKISILKTMNFKGNQIIQNWKVEDLAHQKHIDFSIQKESVTDKINKNIFFKNRLGRCILKAS
jgi:hypothetical protein